MDAAEILIAERGVHGVSIRSITAKAGANIASLHYHFGSLDDLLEAMIERHAGPNNATRTAMLHEFDAKSEPPTARDVVNLIVLPFINMLREQGEDARRAIRFLARLHSDGTGCLQAFNLKHFPDIPRRMGGLLMQACPHLTPDALRFRITMSLDLMLQSLANANFMIASWGETDAEEELDAYCTCIMDFLTAGLEAPVSDTLH